MQISFYRSFPRVRGAVRIYSSNFFFLQSLSRVHAILEVDKKDGEVIIYDNKSMNHTWKDNKKLKPQVRYNLTGGEKLKFGCVCAVFQLHVTAKDVSAENSTFLGNEKGK